MISKESKGGYTLTKKSCGLVTRHSADNPGILEFVYMYVLYVVFD